MYTIKNLNANNVDDIKDLYKNFLDRAIADYKFEVRPLLFEDFKENVKNSFIKGFYLEENDIPTCFLFYVDTINEAVELNLIHCLDESCINEKRSEITKFFTEYVKKNSDKKVISYPMMGIQDTFVQNIAYIGYKLVGQAVLRFDFKNPICIKILDDSKTADCLQKVQIGNGDNQEVDLSANYTIDSWHDNYYEEIVQIIHEQFKEASDTLFDPRFKTIEGTENVVKNIVENIYGIFLQDATTVLKFNDKVCGVCFANMTTEKEANIPLVAIKKPHHHKGFGAMILKHTIRKLREIRGERGIDMLVSVNATTDTDNYPAMRMYRKIGFKEIYNYPHAYFKLKI
ncbi:MAG: GNAT family N-acetyltransferase [Candidatus Gastranaerophilaceae bacterium]|jgi:ribosomal protein S18 acetylase RimI-like enzyme